MRRQKDRTCRRRYVTGRDLQCCVRCTTVVFRSENASWLDCPRCLLLSIVERCGGSLFSSRARGESRILVPHFARVCVNVLFPSASRVRGAWPYCTFERTFVSVSLLVHRWVLSLALPSLDTCGIARDEVGFLMWV